ncbi:MAG TPA: hypothetical protein VHE78_09880 [Gemmatimonadaceae bacterium]|nr:hypothetical protein [Gemmatimonadaceae bacterium]
MTPADAFIPSREERARDRLEAEQLATRDARRALFRVAAECWFWCLLGLACLAWSLHTGDQKSGWVAFWGGLVIGNGGLLFALTRHYNKAKERGDI